MRRMNLLLLILATLTLLVPSIAQASELQMAGGKGARTRIRDREVPPRQGIALGVGVRPGAVAMSGAYIPSLRAQFELSGGVSDRFTLGVALGGTAYLGLDSGSFNGDIVAYRFFGRGLWLRGALGVASHAPALASVPPSPALGGVAGLGYEFRVFERMALGLGADYDMRVRIDGRLAHAFFVGLRFTGYLDKKKR